MAAHQGRNEVMRLRSRLKTVATAIDGAGLNSELTSHYARYLCVLISGYAEQSVKELVMQYCRVRSETRIQRHVGIQLKRLRNVDQEKLRQLVESFDVTWWETLVLQYQDQLSAFDSVAALRNNISHGGDAGVTMVTIRQYLKDVETVLDALSDLFDPKNS